VNGLRLAETYYRDVGAPMIGERFGSFVDRIAVGLVGPGSECLGFDDELSRDHDWGPAFSMWLTDEDLDEIGGELQRAYVQLPATFLGYGPRLASPGEEWRVGTSTTSAFFARFTGLAHVPTATSEWLRIPEHSLATCTNGKVFHDPLGEFTRWRGRSSPTTPRMSGRARSRPCASPSPRPASTTTRGPSEDRRRSRRSTP